MFFGAVLVSCRDNDRPREYFTFLLLLVIAFFLSVASQQASDDAAAGIGSFLILFYLLALFSGDMNTIGGFIMALLLIASAPALTPVP